MIRNVSRCVQTIQKSILSCFKKIIKRFPQTSAPPPHIDLALIDDSTLQRQVGGPHETREEEHYPRVRSLGPTNTSTCPGSHDREPMGAYVGRRIPSHMKGEQIGMGPIPIGPCHNWAPLAFLGSFLSELHHNLRVRCSHLIQRL